MNSHNHQHTPRRAVVSNVALFDYERSLARLGGDPELLKELVILFLQDSPVLLERAQRASREQNIEELARAAHSLKSLSANFDAVALAQAAATVERHAHDGSLERATGCFKDLERELERLQTALARL